MTHVRQQIREAAATALAGLATSGARVFQSRLAPLDADSLPCLLINTDDGEISGLRISSPDLLDRRLTLSIRAVAKVASNLDDTLDDMIKEVESTLGTSTFGGLVKTLQLEAIAIDMQQAEKPVGVATLKYIATYMTVANAPATAI